MRLALFLMLSPLMEWAEILEALKSDEVSVTGMRFGELS